MAAWHVCARTCHLHRVQANPTEFIAVDRQEPLRLRDSSGGLVHTVHSTGNGRQQAGRAARTAAGISRVSRGHGSGPLRVETTMAAITVGTNAFCNHRLCQQLRLLQYSATALSRSSTTRISIRTRAWKWNAMLQSKTVAAAANVPCPSCFDVAHHSLFLPGGSFSPRIRYMMTASKPPNTDSMWRT